MTTEGKGRNKTQSNNTKDKMFVMNRIISLDEKERNTIRSYENRKGEAVHTYLKSCVRFGFQGLLRKGEIMKFS
jgi:DNA-directed RNA polymerase specialized sigma subunit